MCRLSPPRSTAASTRPATSYPGSATPATACSAPNKTVFGWLPTSVDPYEFVDAVVLGQTGINVALRVDADAVDMAALHSGEHISLSITHANLRGLAVVFLLGNVEIAVLAAGDVVGAAHAGPLAEVLALGREDLDALVRAVADVELAVVIEGDGVRQMELAAAMTGFAPRFDEPAVAGEAVDAGVPVAVGHIDVAIGVTDHLGRVV